MNYVLDGHAAKLEPDLMKWAHWFETADRNVAKTKVGEWEISTVFLGVDHSFDGGPPVLFETMVFEPEDPNSIGRREVEDAPMQRYSTWEEAERGHNEIVEEMRRRVQ